MKQLQQVVGYCRVPTKYAGGSWHQDDLTWLGCQGKRSDEIVYICTRHWCACADGETLSKASKRILLCSCSGRIHLHRPNICITWATESCSFTRISRTFRMRHHRLFKGKGKLSYWKAFSLSNDEILSSFASLGKNDIVTDETLHNLEEFLCRVYQPKSKSQIKTLAALRWSLFSTKQTVGDSLPPTTGAFIPAVKRANFQAIVWAQDDIAMPAIPSPTEHGRWKMDGCHRLWMNRYVPRRHCCNWSSVLVLKTDVRHPANADLTTCHAQNCVNVTATRISAIK